MSDSETGIVYAGISGVQLRTDEFDLGDGVVLKKTFAHLFSPFLVAFAPPGPGGYHPAPWSAAEGGIGFDVHIELSVPSDYSLGGDSNAYDVVWWIVALLRVAQHPYASVPVLSDRPFSAVPTLRDQKVQLRPNEVRRRILGPGPEADTSLQDEFLQWVRERWIPAGRLVFSHPGLFTMEIAAG